jgi:hypothetical protein
VNIDGIVFSLVTPYPHIVDEPKKRYFGAFLSSFVGKLVNLFPSSCMVIILPLKGIGSLTTKSRYFYSLSIEVK